jgi:hypothetical protein
MILIIDFIRKVYVEIKTLIDVKQRGEFKYE